jgi:hypothetical protein
MKIIEIGERDIKEASELLAEAFVDDPIFSYIFKTRKAYDQKAAWLFGTWVRWAIMFGKAWITEDRNAVIIMRALGDGEMSFASMVKAGMLAVLFKLGLGSFYRFYFKVVAALDKNHAEVMGSRPHWYGWMVGTKPAQKGTALWLLNHCEAIADKEHLPIFLETSITRNVQLYNRFGFDTRKTLPAEELGFPLYFMVREPKADNKPTR